MKIDIIICSYNRAEMLKKAVQSILSADIQEKASVQLIIVNNNSFDDTEEVINKFQNIYGIKIKHLFEARQGKSHALNTALRNITGDLIAFTDDDITVDKGWIGSMADVLARHTRYNCFGGKVISVYPEKMPDWLDIKGSMKFLKSAFVDVDGGDKEREYGKGTVSLTPPGCNMFFRRNAIDSNGLFRTDLGPRGKELGFSEDTEYFLRFIKRGERCLYAPSVVVYHPVHSERLRKDYLLKWQYQCARSEVRRSGGYKDTIKIFGVPRYVFKKFIVHAAGWWLSLYSQDRFYHKLRLYYSTGELLEHLRIKHGSSIT